MCGFSNSGNYQLAWRCAEKLSHAMFCTDKGCDVSSDADI